MIFFTKRISVDGQLKRVGTSSLSMYCGVFCRVLKLGIITSMLFLTGVMYGQTHVSSLVHGTGGAMLIDASSVFVSGDYAYVAGYNSNALEIVDISDPSLPVHKSSLKHGTGGALLVAPSSIFVSGNYAYITSLGSNALEIVDISDPSAPVHKGSLEHDISGYGALLTTPMSVYVSGNYAYVASYSNDALEIVDISNPAAPVHKGRLIHGTGGALLNDLQSVYVSGNYAYVASFGSDALEVVDISNPAAPVHKGSLTHGSGGAMLDGPISVSVSGNYAYVASYNSYVLEIVDISNPAAPVHKGSVAHGSGGAMLDGAVSVSVSGNYAYVAGYNSDVLEIVDISNPAAPAHKGSVADGAGGALLDAARFVFISGTYAYIAVQGYDALEIVNISNPSSPAHVGNIINGAGKPLLAGAQSVYVSGSYAYVASAGINAFEVVDISNPAIPVHKGSLTNGTNGALLNSPQSVFVSGNYAYVTSIGDKALEIIDISNPAAPVHKGSLTHGTGGALLDYPQSVYVSGNYAYVASYSSDALEIIDISNPAAPVHKGSLKDGMGGALLSRPWSVYVSGNYAYVASTLSNALEIVDISNPALPVHKGSLASGTGGALLQTPTSVFVSGSHAYVTSAESDALEIIDISNPSAPVYKGNLKHGTDGALLDLPYSVAVSRDYAFVVSRDKNTLELIDISNPSAPVHVGSLIQGSGGALLDGPSFVFASGDYAYVVSRFSGALEIFHAAKQDQTIDFDAIASKTYGAASFQLNATASSGLVVAYKSSNTAVATISGSTVTVVGVGTTTITASQAGNPHYYAATSVSHTFTVNKAALTAKADDKTRPYGSDNPALTISYSGFVNGDDASDITVPVASTTATSSSSPGAYAIVPTGGSADNYAIAYTNGTLTITKADQAITFDALDQKTMGDPDFTLTATSSSGLDVIYSSSDPSVAQVNGNTVTIVGDGTTEITATQPGNINYNEAIPVVHSLVVKLAQIITFGPLDTKKYGDAAFQLNATSSSGLPVTYESLNTAVATIDGNVVAIVGAGTAKIVARQAGDAQYNPADEVQQTLIVSKATQTITFNALPDKRLSDETFILPATASSGLPVSYVSSHPDIASIDGNRIILHKAGKIAIAANQAGNENYEPAMQVPQILNILKNLQSIAFAELPSKMFGEAPFTLSATASSSLPVVYESSNAAVATVVNNTVTLQGAGTTVITATQSGNDTFEAASSVQQTLVVELITDLEGRAEVLVGVYPNPVHDALSVSVASVGPVRIEMFDAMGRVVARETASSGEDAALQVDHLQPGIYHVKISTAHQVVTRQIIKK